MSGHSQLPPMVTTRRSKLRTEHLEEEDSNSDFDEFGFDSRPSQPIADASQQDASVKKNKTRLGKIMSKTAKTLGNSLTAVSMLSQKKHSDHSERDSFSAPSTPGVASSFSGFRGSQSSSMAPIAPLSRTAPVVKSPEVTRARPESLPINRSASKVPVRAMSSRLTPQRPSQDFSGNEEHNSDVEEKPSPARYSSSDSAQLLSPTVVAHSFSARIPKGITTARADTVVPVLKVQNLLQSSGNSAKHHPALLNVLTDEEADDSVHAFKELEFPTPPAHPIHLPSSYSFRDRSDSSARNSSSFAQAPVSTSLPLNEVDRSETRTVEESKTTEPAQTSYEFPAEPSQEVFYSSNPPVTAHPLQIDAQPLAIVRYMRLLVRYSPQPLSSMFARVEPAINKWAHALHFLFLTVYILLEILLELSIEAYTALKPYRPELLFPSFAGLVMCFFGGSFVTTIAAAEAYRLVGYETTLQCVRSLMEDFQNVLEAAEKDAALGIDDVEPAMQDMQDSESSKQPDRFDIWSDLRQETVGVRSEKMRQNRGMSVDEGEEGSENHSAVYCDGTEMLGEEHDHVGLAAGLEGLAHPHRPHVHTTPVKKTVASATAVTATTSANTATGASAGSRMSTRSSSRKGGVPVENGVPVVRQTTTSKLRKKRRSMFDAHSDGLDAFRASVLEQRTPAKSRPSLLGAPTSSPAGLSGAGAGDTGACAGAGSNGDNSGNNVSSQPISAVAVPSPPPHLRQAKRSSLLTGSQSLEEYQREQEELGADTTASKALFFLQNVDPQRFTNAIVGINAGLVAVVATLKVQFAKTITLGSALSKAIDGPAKMVLKPLVELALPKPYKKWADVLLTYSIKSFAISIAWTLRRVVSSFHSAIRGGLMFSKNLLSYLVDMGVLKEHHINSAYVPYIDTVLGYSVALLGLWFQLSYGFALPFPLNIILFPFTILEYALVWMVNNSHYILGQY